MTDENWKGKPRFIDAGGMAPGGVKKIREGNTERYECLRCDTEQVESKSARHRSSRVRCRHCGNVVYPVTVLPEKPKTLVKFCEKCHAKLRTGNSTMLCSLCDR